MAVQGTRQWDTASREAWERQRLALDVARGNVGRTPEIDAFLRGASKAEAKKLRPQQQRDAFKQLNRELGQLSKQTNKNIHANADKGNAPKLSEVKKAAKEGRTLFAATPSTCFSEVSWTDGVASLTFANKTQGTWDIEMSLEDFLDFTDGSMGQNFNADWYGA